MEERDVTQILSAADDSVSLINGVNDGSWNTLGLMEHKKKSTIWFSVMLTILKSFWLMKKW